MYPRYDHEDRDGLRLGKAAPAEKHSANCAGDENYSGIGFDGGNRDLLSGRLGWLPPRRVLGSR